ncbi:GspH/FimT family pseudopilin [Vibrio sp. CDRSL-10 TSBA]
MVRGFSLLELLITVVILSILLAVAIPDFSQVTGRETMRSLAAQLQGFIHNAKSQAVLRNRDLWGHIVWDADNDSHWRLILSDSSEPGSGERLMTLDGGEFSAVSLSATFARDRIQFDGVRGKVSNGSFYFQPDGKGSAALRLTTSFGASRVMVCSPEEESYGYPKCD